MRLFTFSAATALLALSAHPAGASDLEARKSEEVLKPCTAKSSTSGNYFDINSLHISADKKSKNKEDELHSWHSRGHDYGANFTLNFCGGVVEDLKDMGGVEDIKSSQLKNVSAFYQKGSRIYSIGQESQEPVVRGRKLVLTYTHGSKCPSASDRKREAAADEAFEPREPARKGDDDDEDDDDEDTGRRKGSQSDGRRKSTVISLLCERNPKDGDPDVTVSFVGSVDDCSYFFEARTTAACPTADSPQGGLGPGGVFGVIALITILVYLAGGIMYQRIVQHQRGWRQLPNYGMWSNAFGFVRDMVVILASSCGRVIPGVGRLFGGRKGYSRLSLNGDSVPPGRRGHADSDDENRLIDQLDETWED